MCFLHNTATNDFIFYSSLAVISIQSNRIATKTVSPLKIVSFLQNMHEFAIDVNEVNASFNLIAPKNVELPVNESEIKKSLDDLIQDKIKERKRFFGIEISPASSGEDLDYNKFVVQPLFTSITWLFDNNLKHDSLSMAPAVQLGKTAEKCSSVLMHLTCYKLQAPKLRELLDIGFKNVLALKGGS